ncbi:DUF433 domain-containing protein [Occultella kanbiaonis]|uniref:DUF433 domain-containing protein n=1 Tax=Occultella kanbiaonis TaxID=2675754 RepID=UPI0013D36A86|nr:DUF433 domain-containing protein [Occultella kanbiaonis]
MPYALATFALWSTKKNLVIDAQERAGLPKEYWLYSPVGDRPLLLPPGKGFLASAEFDADVAVRWRPGVDPESPVVVDPELRFGKPAVHGISTVVLWEQSEDGYTDAEIAEEFAISKSDVAWAVAYESSARAAR